MGCSYCPEWQGVEEDSGVMSGQSEKVLGEISGSIPLTIGSEKLRFFFTDRRIIVARVGKRGAGALGLSSLLGRLAAGIEDAFKSGKEAVEKRGMRNLTPQEILHEDEENFAISYDDVVSVDLQQTSLLTQMNFLTKQDKFELLTSSKFDLVLDLLQKTLRGKLTVTRLDPTFLRKRD